MISDTPSRMATSVVTVFPIGVSGTVPFRLGGVGLELDQGLQALQVRTLRFANFGKKHFLGFIDLSGFHSLHRIRMP